MSESWGLVDDDSTWNLNRGRDDSAWSVTWRQNDSDRSTTRRGGGRSGGN